ncbi:hypothetical protein J7M23_08620 [Candidatus Sumerlaeota bacterium]|nr:hypothetical protein [Candidatus Sumerlaeota bacterium]
MRSSLLPGMAVVLILFIPMISPGITNGDFCLGNVGWSDYADPNSSVTYYPVLCYVRVLAYRNENAVTWQEETDFDPGETWQATFDVKSTSVGLGGIITIGWADSSGDYGSYYQDITSAGTYTVECDNSSYRYVSIQCTGSSFTNTIVEVNEVSTAELTPTPTPMPTPTPTDSYNFEGTTENWSFVGPSANSPDATYTGATSSYDSHKIGIGTDNTTNRFGFWQSPVANPYVANKLYKLTWTVSTDQTNPDNVPTFRFRVNDEAFAYSMTMVVSSAGSTNPFMPPTVGTKDYNMYVLPITTNGLFPVFDVYDFDPSGDNGTLYLDELNITRYDVPGTGWTAESVAPFSSWSALTSVSPFHAVTSGTSGGLQLSSSVSENYAFGLWNSPADIAYTDNQLYRAIFTIQSSDSSPPNGMLRVASQDNQVNYRLSYYSATKPDSDGEDYPIYFETHDYESSANHFFLNFEIADFENTQGGTITLTNVTVERHDLLP